MVVGVRTARTSLTGHRRTDERKCRPTDATRVRNKRAARRRRGCWSPAPMRHDVALSRGRTGATAPAGATVAALEVERRAGFQR